MPHTVAHSVPSAQSVAASQHCVLACIDGSHITPFVCDYAAWYAQKLNLPITLLHVVHSPKSSRHDLSGTIGMDSRQSLLYELTRLDEETARLTLKHGEALVRDAKTQVLNSVAYSDDTEVYTHLRHGKLLSAIEHFASKTRLVIMGRRSADYQHEYVNIGSHIESVARAIQHPILICSEPFTAPSSYMLAFDGSPTAIKAVQMICDSDLSRGTQGYLVMVGNHFQSREDSLYEAQRQLVAAGLAVTVHLFSSKQHSDNVVKTLTTFQRENDISMIIIGAYGHAKWRRFFVGSTTTELLAQTHVPVLLLH